MQVIQTDPLIKDPESESFCPQKITVQQIYLGFSCAAFKIVDATEGFVNVVER